MGAECCKIQDPKTEPHHPKTQTTSTPNIFTLHVINAKHLGRSKNRDKPNIGFLNHDSLKSLQKLSEILVDSEKG